MCGTWCSSHVCSSLFGNSRSSSVPLALAFHRSHYSAPFLILHYDQKYWLPHLFMIYVFVYVICLNFFDLILILTSGQANHRRCCQVSPHRAKCPSSRARAKKHCSNGTAKATRSKIWPQYLCEKPVVILLYEMSKPGFQELAL